MSPRLFICVQLGAALASCSIQPNPSSVCDGVAESRVVANTGNLPDDLALFGDQVYWVTFWDSTVSQASRLGGPSTNLFVSESRHMRIAVDSETIYWRTAAGDVFSIGKNGGLVSLLFEATDCDPGDNCGDFLAQNDSDIFWVDQPHGQILGRAKVGGETRVIVEDAAYPRTLVADAEFIYWSAFLYDEIGDDLLSAVQRRPIAGGDIELLHSRSVYPGTLDYAVLTDGFLYGDWNYEGIWKIAADGSSAELLIPDAHPRRLASDGVMLYWTESTGSGVAPLVLAAPLSGGGPIPVACSKKSGTGLGAESPLAIAVDESGVYWADERSDRIMAADLVRVEAPN